MWYGAVRAGLGWFCLVTSSKRQHGLEVPGLVPGGPAQTPPKPLQIHHVHSPAPPEGPGEPRWGTHPFSILLESLLYRSLLLSSLWCGELTQPSPLGFGLSKKHNPCCKHSGSQPWADDGPGSSPLPSLLCNLGTRYLTFLDVSFVLRENTKLHPACYQGVLKIAWFPIL